ncbi:MAG: efflux RND transporter periplasmic adaptor subunit [Magnetovibrio sp.]|nr:efflux RND transporter periplasmic adaptor subunit [Magnetovibrio sp.]
MAVPTFAFNIAVRTCARAVLLGGLGVVIAGTMPIYGPAYAQEKKHDDAEDGDQVALVGVDTVIRERARQTVPVIGRLVAQQSGVVSVLIKGVVAKISVRVGDRVAPGDVMARLRPNSLKWSRDLRAAEVESAKASLENAKTQASLRRQELKRLENLKKSAAFSVARFEDAQKELAKAQSDAARAVAELAVATANVNLAQIDLDNADVKAPYAGVVSAVHTEIGTYLNTGQSVVTLVDDANMEIEADVPAHRTPGLLAGTKVHFTTNGSPQHVATVRAAVPQGNPLTRTRTVRFVPAPGTITSGSAANQTVSILIPAGPARDVVTVHKDAILNKAGKRVVFIFQDGKAKLRPVNLGEAVGTRFIVMSGLKPGDSVVVRGNERLTPDQDIQDNASSQ